MRDFIMFMLMLAASYWLYSSGALENFVLSLGTFMNIGVLIAGMFYSSTITLPLALALFSTYTGMMSPLRIAMAASVGAMLADVIFFLGMSKVVGREINFLGIRVKVPHPKSELAKIGLALAGGIFLALPFLPDEIAVAVLSLSRLELNRFMALSLLFKFLGILGLAWALILF